jgi:hypothetical protein
MSLELRAKMAAVDRRKQKAAQVMIANGQTSPLNNRALFKEAISGLKSEHVGELMFYYDCLTKQTGDENAVIGLMYDAFRQIQNSTASHITKLPLGNSGKVIKQDLERFNQAHKGVDANPRTRLKSAIERIRANILKCAVDGVELSKEELEGAMPKVPDCLKQTSYQATANYRGKKVQNLEVTVKI